MSETESVLEILKEKIVESLQTTTDEDLLDYIFKLLIAESR